MGSLVIYDPHGGDLKDKVPKTGIRGPLTVGILTVVLGLGSMVAWAALAPLNSAVVAPGVLEPESGRKTVKHNEGGVIAEVLVHEGDTVNAGAPLIRLDRTEAETQLAVLTDQLTRAQAQEARLQAERDMTFVIRWPDRFLAARNDPRIAAEMKDQQSLFDARVNQYLKALDTGEKRIDAFEAQVAQLENQRKRYRTAEGYGRDLVQMQRTLDAQHLVRKNEYLSSQRQNALDQVSSGQIDSQQSEINQKIVDAKADLVKIRTERATGVAADLVEARGKVQDTLAKIVDAKNKVANRVIAAPDSGVVTGFRHVAPGAAITPNEPILDIVPANDRLLVEAKVQTKDIKELVPGLKTKLVLSAYDSRVVGAIDGTVEYVSADRMTDPSNQQTYYLVKIRPKDATPHEVHNLRIVAGMPIEARITISARTPLDYLVAPLVNAYDRAFIQ